MSQQFPFKLCQCLHMAKKLMKSEKLQRQVERLEKRFEGRFEKPKEQKSQDVPQTTSQIERQPTERSS